MRFIDTSLEFVAADGATRVRVGLLITHLLNASKHYDSSGAGIRAAVRTEAAVRASHTESGEPTAPLIRLDDPDWRFLCAVLDDPQPMDRWRPYPISPARLLVPLIDSIKAAPETEPVAEEPKTNGVTATEQPS
jgi:hypothetical protein